MSVTREQFLKTTGLVREKVNVPEWENVTVWVRSLTLRERHRFETGLLKSAALNLSNARAALLVEVLVDEKGNKIFELSDVEALGAKSGSALQRLFSVAQRLSGLGNA